MRQLTALANCNQSYGPLNNMQQCWCMLALWAFIVHRPRVLYRAVCVRSRTKQNPTNSRDRGIQVPFCRDIRPRDVGSYSTTSLSTCHRERVIFRPELATFGRHLNPQAVRKAIFVSACSLTHHQDIFFLAQSVSIIRFHICFIFVATSACYSLCTNVIFFVYSRPRGQTMPPMTPQLTM